MTTPSRQSPPNNRGPQVIFVLRISSGSFETGFAAMLEISEPGRLNPHQRYSLPPCPELPSAYSDWQESYSALNSSQNSSTTRKIQPVPGQTVQRSYAERQSECKQATIAFEDRCTAWFEQPIFEALRRSILAAVKTYKLQQVSIFLDPDTSSPEQNLLLRKLPWHVWSLFDELRRSELILNAPVTPINHQLSGPVKILAVFGSQAGGLQLNGDLATLEDYISTQGAQLTLLDRPDARELQIALRQRPWDILFFAGHSSSCSDTSGGIIQVRDDVVLSLRDLKPHLNQAVENGLKLAIFNSCDGLSLADYLAARKVPVSIVMREPVPDRVAHHFLEYFLQEFSQGQTTLTAAVRIARERLQWLESDGAQACPAATWLPIICQNPNQSPLLWPAAPALVNPPLSNLSLTGLSPTNQSPTNLPPTIPSKYNSSTTLQTSLLTPSPTGQLAPTALHSTSVPTPPVPTPPLTPIQTLLHQPTAPASTPSASAPENSETGTLPAVVSQPPSKRLLRAGAILLFLLMIAGKGIATFVEKSNQSNSAYADPAVYATLQDRFSAGDRELLTTEANSIECNEPQKFQTAKEKGIQLFKAGRSVAAAAEFKEAFDECRSPEALIYHNNALIGDEFAYELAVAVPYAKNRKNAIEMLRGAAMAQNKINQAGGLNGVPLKLIVVDDSDKPSVAADIANELIDNTEVLGTVGHWTSGVSLEAVKVYWRRKSLAFITPISMTSNLEDYGEWVFRSASNIEKAQRAVVDYLTEQQYTKAAVFYVDEAQTSEASALYSKDLRDQFDRLFSDAGGEVITGGENFSKFSLADPGFKTDAEAIASAMVQDAQAQGAQVIVLAPNNDLVGNAEQVIKAANEAGLAVVGDTNLYRQEVLEATCPYSEGMVAGISWQGSGRANSTYVNEARNLWGGDVNFATAMTYNATQAMAEAIRRSSAAELASGNVSNVSRETVKDALNAQDFVVEDTADAEAFRFDENRTRAAEAQLVKVVKSEREPVQCRYVAIEENS